MRASLIIIGVVTLVLDQWTKSWAHEALIGRGVVEITSFFNLVLVWNTGVSFGMFNDQGEMGRWILVAVASLVGIGLLVWIYREERFFARFTLTLILAGAIGNVIDRVRFGAVIDFLDFHVMGYHWPAFNIADCAIVVGAILLLVDGLFFAPASPDEKRSEVK